MNKDGKNSFFLEGMKTRINKIKDYDSSLSLNTTQTNKNYATFYYPDEQI